MKKNARVSLPVRTQADKTCNVMKTSDTIAKFH